MGINYSRMFCLLELVFTHRIYNRLSSMGILRKQTLDLEIIVHYERLIESVADRMSR